ncbi:hypothetical protein F4803DRAFT_573954 [Xylaria telfairii]|nr:hypothetical protein F4803DRAFT_573954 [Xylaria telfairii]
MRTAVKPQGRGTRTAVKPQRGVTPTHKTPAAPIGPPSSHANPRQATAPALNPIRAGYNTVVGCALQGGGAVDDNDVFNRQAAHSTRTAKLWHSLWHMDGPENGALEPTQPTTSIVKRTREEEADDPALDLQETRLRSLGSSITVAAARAMFGRRDLELRTSQQTVLECWTPYAATARSSRWQEPVAANQSHPETPKRHVHQRSLWNSDDSNVAKSSVILVAPEAMKQREWQQFVIKQRGRRLLDRVILDEAQEVLIANSKQVFLTGTLPPAAEAEFIRMLNLDPPNTRLLRSTTTRANLRFGFIEADLAAAPIYLRKIELAILFYHARLGLVNQDANLDTWLKQAGFIVATTAIGLGVDYQRVDLVVCIDAFDLTTMLQQFERAGRGGGPATALLIAKTSELKGLVQGYAKAECKRRAGPGSSNAAESPPLPPTPLTARPTPPTENHVVTPLPNNPTSPGPMMTPAPTLPRPRSSRRPRSSYSYQFSRDTAISNEESLQPVQPPPLLSPSKRQASDNAPGGRLALVRQSSTHNNFARLRQDNMKRLRNHGLDLDSDDIFDNQTDFLR